MIHVAGEVIIIILCVFHRLIKNLKKTSAQPQKVQIKPIPQVQKQPEPIKKNSELEELQLRKKQIQSTIEELNNPNTFAKYSKMKRQLIKIDAKINQIKQKSNQEQQQSKQHLQIQKEAKQTKSQSTIKHTKSVQKDQYLMPAWFGVFFNIFIMCLAFTLSTSVLPNYEKFPVNLFTDENGRANCILVYFACKMIMS